MTLRVDCGKSWRTLTKTRVHIKDSGVTDTLSINWLGSRRAVTLAWSTRNDITISADLANIIFAFPAKCSARVWTQSIDRAWFILADCTSASSCTAWASWIALLASVCREVYIVFLWTLLNTSLFKVVVTIFAFMTGKWIYWTTNAGFIAVDTMLACFHSISRTGLDAIAFIS